MSTHTPGPWQWGIGNDYYIERVGTDAEDSATIAITYTEPDARLIAQAPAMRQWLEAFVADFCPNASELAKYRASARAVLRAANGDAD